jgi:hypothetical protein
MKGRKVIYSNRLSLKTYILRETLSSLDTSCDFVRIDNLLSHWNVPTFLKIRIVHLYLTLDYTYNS